MKYHGYNIIFVGRNILHDYLGMNYFAAKKMSFPFYYSKKTMLVRDYLKGKELREVILHEIREIRDMRRGDGYWKAHVKAIKREKKYEKYMRNI